ncbi:MAG: macro domain-containing protein, partial [Myxococcota bacterium]
HWPAMYKDFRHYCRQSHPKAGTLWMWGGTGGTRIFSLMTQEAAYDHGSRPRKATTANVNHCLREWHQATVKENIPSIALPKLATDVGGLDWDEVRP